jgi:drug/metabolite transporter (DMT)-like permease
VWARFFFHALFVLAIMGVTLTGAVRSRRPWMQLLRSALLLTTTVLFFIGIRSIPLATASTIMFLSPIFITILSAPLLGEPVGVRRIAGVVIGFIGALIVVRPGIAPLSVGVLCLIAAACTNALHQITTRLLRHHDDPMTTLLYTAAVGAALLSAVAPFEWRAPDPTAWIFLVGIGIAGGLGHLCLIRALRLAPASAVAPFSYTGLLWAALFGFTVFGEVPGLWTLVGAALIIGSGLYIFHRERAAAARSEDRQP